MVRCMWLAAGVALISDSCGARELRDAWATFTVPDDAGYVERLLIRAGDSVTNGTAAVIRYFGADIV